MKEIFNFRRFGKYLWTDIKTGYMSYGISLLSLGLAGIETRLEKMLEPLIRANQADPIHKLYLLTKQASALRITGGRIELIEKSSLPADTLALSRLQELLAKLKANNMRQIEVMIRNEPYYVSGIAIPTLEAVLLQMISVADMENHNHELSF